MTLPRYRRNVYGRPTRPVLPGDQRRLHQRRRCLRGRADDRVLRRGGAVGNHLIPRKRGDSPFRARVQPRLGQRVNAGIGRARAGLPGDPQPVREHLRDALADSGNHPRRLLGDVEGAHPAPLRRDCGGARRLGAVLRPRDRDSHTARKDDRPGEQTVQSALHGAAVTRQRRKRRQRIAGEDSRQRPALRTARPEPLDGSRVRRDRALRDRQPRQAAIGRSQTAQLKPGDRHAARRPARTRHRSQSQRQDVHQRPQQVRHPFPPVPSGVTPPRRRARSARTRR